MRFLKALQAQRMAVHAPYTPRCLAHPARQHPAHRALCAGPDGTRTVDPEDRPYTVTEHAYGLREESPSSVGQEQRLRIFFPHPSPNARPSGNAATTRMTQFAFTDQYDPFGQPQRQTTIAMPRRSAKRHAVTGAVIGTVAPDETHVLATHTWTTYAAPQAGVYIHDRVAQVKTYELASPPVVAETSPANVIAVLKDQWSTAQSLHIQFMQGAGVHLFAHVVNHYDGQAFVGKAPGDAGQYGALTRSEALVFTDPLLDDAYAGDPGKPSRRPDYLGGTLSMPAGAPARFGGSTGYHLKNADSAYEAGYYADTKRIKFDFQDATLLVKRGVVVAMQDALRHEAKITLDAYWYLPVSVKDAAGLETKAKYNDRTLQPSLVTDPNDNQTHFRYISDRAGAQKCGWSPTTVRVAAKQSLNFCMTMISCHFERTRAWMHSPSMFTRQPPLP